MENNQTAKNMELMLLELRKNAMTKGSNTKESKTLIHSYLTLLSSFRGSRLDFALHADQLHTLKYYVEEDKMKELFNNRDYIGINNYATVMSKVEQALEIIGTPKTNKNHSSLRLIEDLLNQSIKTGTLVTFHDESHRCTGKTTALIKKAHELDCVLVTGLGTYKKCSQTIADGLRLNVEIVGNPNEVKETPKIKNGYLVDEMVSLEQMRALEGYKLIGGFHRVVI